MSCHREVFNFNAVRFSLGFYLRVGLDKDQREFLRAVSNWWERCPIKGTLPVKSVFTTILLKLSYYRANCGDNDCITEMVNSRNHLWTSQDHSSLETKGNFSSLLSSIRDQGSLEDNMYWNITVKELVVGFADKI